MGSLQSKLLAPVVAGSLVVVLASLAYMFYVTGRQTELVGLTTARSVSQEVATVRAFYAAEVVTRVRARGMEVNYDYEHRQDTLPLPATLVNVLGEQIAEAYPGTKIRLYSRWPFPHRVADGTARMDNFEREAHEALVANPEMEFWRIENYEGRESIRYAVADVMREACVDCHNNHPQTPRRDWRVGDVRGAVEVIIPIEEAKAGLLWNTYLLGALITAGMFLSVVVAGFLLRRTIRPVGALTEVLKQVGAGNLDVTAPVTTSDELGRIIESTNVMVQRLRDMVMRLDVASVQVSGAAEQILRTSTQHEESAVEQSSGFEEIARTASGNSEAARGIATEANNMARAAEEMLQAAELGRDALAATSGRMSDIVAQNEIVTNRINSLYEQTQAIITVVGIIDNISDRLDLLALNAGLEGSRAGEVGKGFSLVAQEMRRLAESVSESTREIKTTVQEIHRFTKVALDASSESSVTTRQGAGEMEKMNQAIAQIFSLIESTHGVARRITGATQQQLSSTEQMVTAMEEMNTVSTRALSASRDSTRAAADLAELAESVRGAVSQFVIERDDKPEGKSGASKTGGARSGRQ